MGDAPGEGPPEPTDSQQTDSQQSKSEQSEQAHVPEGLELARSIARSVAKAGRAGGPRRRKKTRYVEPQSAGAHPDGRDPQTLSAAMDRLVANKGWSTDVSVHTLLGRWPTLVGPVNAAHTEPVGYADGVLTVQADATVWASSLRAMAPQLVAKLNESLGDGTVTRVDVRGPVGPSWKRGRRSVSGRGPRDTYG